MVINIPIWEAEVFQTSLTFAVKAGTYSSGAFKERLQAVLTSLRMVCTGHNG
jgi:hypothetical protein